MSLIGSVRDGMQDLRKKAINQERSIDRNSEFSHWRMSDATGVSVIERAAGVAIIPVAVFWGLVLLVFGLGIGVSLVSFKLLGRFFR